MNQLEQSLYRQGNKLSTVNCPGDLIDRLQNCKDGGTKSKRKVPSMKVLAIAISLLIVLILPNYNLIRANVLWIFGDEVYYHRNYEDVLEHGLGQVIGEEHKFNDGRVLYVDAVFIEDEKMNIIYRSNVPNTIEFQGVYDGDKVYNKIMSGSGSSRTGSSDMTYYDIRVDFEPSLLSEDYELRFKRIDNKRNKEIFETVNVGFEMDYDKIIRSTYITRPNEIIETQGFSVHIDEITVSPLSVFLQYTVDVKEHIHNESTDYSFRMEMQINDNNLLDYSNTSRNISGKRVYVGGEYSGVKKIEGPIVLKSLDISRSRELLENYEIIVGTEKVYLKDEIILWLEPLNESEVEQTVLRIEKETSFNQYFPNLVSSKGVELDFVMDYKEERKVDSYIFEGTYDELLIRSITTTEHYDTIDIDYIVE